MPKHPEVKVKLTGADGNAFAIIGAVVKAMRKAGLDASEFIEEATADDYNHLLATALKYVEANNLEYPDLIGGTPK